MSIVMDKISYSIKSKQIIDELSLEIKKGEVLCVLGPNGSGKSTLIRIIAGDLNPNSGSISIDGTNLNKIKLSTRAEIRSVMSQTQSVVYDYSVKDIIEMGWMFSNNKSFNNNFEQILKLVTNECGIDKLLKRKFNSLSGGEQRMVHFARTLIQSSSPDNNTQKYMLFDEPTANLDIKKELSILEIIRNRARDGYGILVVLHDLNIAYNFSDKVMLIKDGNMETMGYPDDVFNDETLSKVYEVPVRFDKRNGRVNYY
tara:strand:- start:1944 stop:2714 length:771 start_codon:yes stop_codon:yes gene_type:complete